MRTFSALAACLLLPGVAAAQSAIPPIGSSAPSGYSAPPPGPARPAPSSGANVTGLGLSAAFGYGSPLGDVFLAVPLGDLVAAQFPIVVGAGYRPHPRFSFGASFMYAPLSSKPCSTGTSCSLSDRALDFEARLHFMADSRMSPWISAGLGYEWFKNVESGGTSYTLHLGGVEYVFQVGGDIRVASRLTVGPFVSVRFGTFTSGPLASYDQHTTHGWLAFGLRGVFTG